MCSPNLSPLRGKLASSENAYAVAVQLRAAGGTEQFVISTGDPMQPFRVSGEPPVGQERFLALVARGTTQRKASAFISSAAVGLSTVSAAVK